MNSDRYGRKEGMLLIQALFLHITSCQVNLECSRSSSALLFFPGLSRYILFSLIKLEVHSGYEAWGNPFLASTFTDLLLVVMAC